MQGGGLEPQPSQSSWPGWSSLMVVQAWSEQVMFNKVRDVVRAQGVWGLAGRSIAYAYRRGVRPFSPSKPIQYAGIPICYDRILSDRFVPAAWVLGKGDPGERLGYQITGDALSYEATFGDQPDYEAALVAGLKTRRSDLATVYCRGRWRCGSNGSCCSITYRRLRQRPML